MESVRATESVLQIKVIASSLTPAGSSLPLPACYTVGAMKRSLQEIAQAIGARLIGDGRVEVSGVASIASASRGDLVFVEDEKYLAEALQSAAGAVIAGQFAAAGARGRPLLISEHPKLAFARAARVLQGDLPVDGATQQGSVHPTAVIHSSVVLGPCVLVEARAVVGEHAQIGQRTCIGAGCVLGSDV